MTFINNLFIMALDGRKRFLWGGDAAKQSNRACTKYLLRSLPFLYNSKTHDTEHGTVRFALCIQCSYLAFPRLRTFLTQTTHTVGKNICRSQAVRVQKRQEKSQLRTVSPSRVNYPLNRSKNCGKILLVELSGKGATYGKSYTGCGRRSRRNCSSRPFGTTRIFCDRL